MEEGIRDCATREVDSRPLGLQLCVAPNLLPDGVLLRLGMMSQAQPRPCKPHRYGSSYAPGWLRV